MIDLSHPRPPVSRVYGHWPAAMTMPGLFQLLSRQQRQLFLACFDAGDLIRVPLYTLLRRVRVTGDLYRAAALLQMRERR